MANTYICNSSRNLLPWDLDQLETRNLQRDFPQFERIPNIVSGSAVPRPKACKNIQVLENEDAVSTVQTCDILNIEAVLMGLCGASNMQ